MKIRIVILGVGRWGNHLVRNFLENPEAKIIAIVDPNQVNLTQCQEKYQLNPNEVKLVNNWQEIQHDDRIDAVVIATPANTHYQLIKSALNLGYHVLVEKPLTLHSDECLELTQLAKQKKLQLFIDHTYLFNPYIHQFQSLIKQEKIGQTRYGYASRTNLGPIRQDVNAMWDLAIHDIAIFNFILDQIPIKVQAESQIWLQENLADLVWVKLIYPDDFITTIHLSWLNPDKQRKLVIVGDKGSLIFDEMLLDSPLILQQGYLVKKENTYIPDGLKQEVITVPKLEPLQLVCDRFLANIKTSANDELSSGELATNLVKILEALTLSLEQNNIIVEV